MRDDYEYPYSPFVNERMPFGEEILPDPMHEGSLDVLSGEENIEDNEQGAQEEDWKSLYAFGGAQPELSEEDFIREFGGMGYGAMWAAASREVDESKLNNAEKIAYRIQNSDEECPEDYRELCEMANMLEEYENAEEGEELDMVIMRAVAALGINMMI